MNLKDFKVRESGDGKVYFISNNDGILLLKNGNVSVVSFRCWWKTRKEAEIFLAGWLSIQQVDTNRIDKEQQFPLGMKHKDSVGRTWTYYHKVKPEPEINIDQIDYEPQFELGTCYVNYLGEAYRYYKLVGGVIAWSGSDGSPIRTVYRDTKYIWRREQ